MSRSKLDASQIMQLSYDEINEAVKVKLQDTEINMELNSADGDNVTSVPSKLTASVTGVTNPADNGTDIIPAIDCSSVNTIRVDINGTGTIEIYASPSDSGSYFYLVGGAGTSFSICARRIKVKSINVNGDVYLVGRS